jgi:histidyl-tRNA synthetase
MLRSLSITSIRNRAITSSVFWNISMSSSCRTAINTRLVRGLDYYTNTVFEIRSTDKDGKNYSLGGGGRYNRLIETLGGEPTPAIGFGFGLDRIVLEMKRTQVKPYQEPKPRVFLAQLGDMAKKKSLRLFSALGEKWYSHCRKLWPRQSQVADARRQSSWCRGDGHYRPEGSAR